MAQLNPHRTRNHGSREHRESIKRMLDKTKRDNRVKVLRGQLQKMAGLQKIAYAGIHSAKPVMDAFKNKKPLRFGEKPKGKKTEYAFQTDGKILYQSGYPIAEHTKNGIKFSYQGHPTATTSDTARYLGIDTFTKKGITYINGQVIDPYGFDYVEVPFSNISDTPVKVNPKSKPIITEQTKQKNRDQEAFRLKAEKESLEGNQDLVVQTKTKKEVLDHGSITKDEQKGIKKITGLGKDVDETFATTYHHSLPAEEGGGIGGGVINRRMTGGAVPLSRKTHYEAHFPEKTIPKSFYKKISQLQGKLQKIATINKNALGNNTMEEIGSYDWKTGKKLSIEQIHALGNGSDVFAVAVTKNLNKNSDFRIPEEYINKDFGVKKIGLVKGIYENKEGFIEHDRTYLFHGSDDEVQRQLNLHNDINKGVTQEEAGRIYKDKDGIVQYENIPNKQFKKTK